MSSKDNARVLICGGNMSSTMATTRGIHTGFRPCPICGSEAFTSVFEPVKKCKSCGLAMVNPLGTFRGESETSEYFLKDYLPLHLANRENSLAERRAHIAAISRYFSLGAHPDHLDVGCALGFMLQEAKASGWHPVGVETSEFAAQYAADHTGCSVRAGTLQQAAFPSESFDVVTLMDVIEHVPEPQDLIGEIYRILRTGGVLFIVTPNFASIFVRLYGLKAYGVWPDQHIVYFQPATMKKLLREIGFERIITGSKDFYPDNLKRLLGRSRSPAENIKTAFGENKSLGRVREIANRILRHIPVGDKLIAFAQK
jgi:2-polyprenyl-3-methyl-5-hydroxy-6-metoxy-1,4-benzoquinol methylase